MEQGQDENLARDLMVRVSRGDDAAFERLVELFRKPVIQTAYRYLGDAALAEDLAQEVFLKIYRARKRYKPLARFETWLHRIVSNVVINAAQSRRRRRTVSLDACGDGCSEAAVTAGRAMDPLARLKKKELHLKVREAVLSLPPNQRMVLILNKYRGLSYQEIAQAQDTTVEAVKSMLFRAREKVREKLEGYMDSEVHHGL